MKISKYEVLTADLEPAALALELNRHAQESPQLQLAQVVLGPDARQWLLIYRSEVER